MSALPDDTTTPALALLERERELALIEDALASAADGRARGLIFQGEAGIGKSTLLGRFADEALRRGFGVYTGRGGPLEAALGFGVVRQLFESSLNRAPAATRRRLLSGSAALAAPLLGLDLPTPVGALAAPTEEFGFQHGLYWLLANVCEQGPVAIVIDDAQWCDRLSLSWLVYLARRIARLPVAIALAARSGEPGLPRELIATLASEPPLTSVELRPLSPRGTRALIEGRHGRAVDADFAAACHEWTRGNPMFVAEVVAELAAEGIEPGSASVPRVRRLIPAGVARITLLRLARLPGQAVALARATAALGVEGQLQYAGALAGLERADAIAAADDLAEARIVDCCEPLRFSHPLIANVVYEDIPPARRAEDHKRAARLLADGGAPAEQVVAQLLRSATCGDAWCAGTLLAGAKRELERGSARTAIEQLRRACDEPPPESLLVEVLLTLGLAESRARAPAAIETLERALAASEDPVARASVALLLGRVLMRAGRTHEAVAALEPAIDALDAGQRDLCLQLEATLITAARFDSDLIEYAMGRVADLGPSVADLPDLTRSHGGRLIAAQICWGATAGGASAAASVELARAALGERPLLGGGPLLEQSATAPDAYLLPVLMLSLCDELEEADAHCARALELARAAGSAPAYAGTACFRSGIAHLNGRLADADLLARDALRLAGGSPDLALVTGLARAYLASILVDRGGLAEARELLGDVSDLENSPLVWATELLFAAGRVRLAARQLTDGLELMLACGRRCLRWRVKNPAWLPWRSQAALALHALGEEARARELCEEELWRARRFGARRPTGIALRASGLIAGGEQGLELLRESAATLSASPAKLEYARTLIALGAAMRRANYRADARKPLSDGLELARVSGAVPLAEEAAAELLACGARPRSVVREGVEELTPSERRICEMAAGGMSNPEIAQALFVTRATVESHLHSAYRKLGLQSRKELARALAEPKSQ